MVVSSGFGGVEVLCDGDGESQVATGCGLGPRPEDSFAPSLLGKCGWEIGQRLERAPGETEVLLHSGLFSFPPQGERLECV